jgi:hypothetical protein
MFDCCVQRVEPTAGNILVRVGGYYRRTVCSQSRRWLLLSVVSNPLTLHRNLATFCEPFCAPFCAIEEIDRLHTLSESVGEMDQAPHDPTEGRQLVGGLHPAKARLQAHTIVARQQTKESTGSKQASRQAGKQASKISP